MKDLKPEDEFKPLGTKGEWALVICFLLPWVLGIGVIGMFLIDLLN